MNKSTNIFLILLAILTIGFTLLIAFDLPITILKISGANFEYTNETYIVLAGLFALLGVGRIVQRWIGINLVNKVQRYQWNQPMAQERIRQAVMYLNIEGFIHLLFGCILYLLTPKSIVVVTVILLLGIDHIVFGIIGKAKKLFRVGITKNAVVFADRETKVAYFSGLRQVSIQQQTIYFDYIKELQVAFPSTSIKKEDRADFKKFLEQNVNREKVYFSESLKEF